MASPEEKLNQFVASLTDAQRYQYRHRITRLRQKNQRERINQEFPDDGDSSSLRPRQVTGHSQGTFSMPVAPVFEPINVEAGKELARITKQKAIDAAKRNAKDLADQTANQFGGSTGDATELFNTAKGFKDQFDIVKKDEDRDKKWADLKAATKGFNLVKALHPSHKKLDDVEIERAHLAKAGKIKESTGQTLLAQEYLDRTPGMEDYKIDDELSTANGLVVTNPQGKPELSFRGTNKWNLSDLAENARILGGRSKGSDREIEANNLHDAAVAKYEMPVEHVSGFSLGANIGMRVGNTNNVETTAFNPHMGLTKGKLNPDADLTIIRTTSDIPSLGLALTKTGDNVKVKSVNPVEHSFLPHKSHVLENFTSRRNFRADDTHLNKLLKNVGRASSKHGQYDMLKLNMESADKGLSFTDHIKQYNSGRSGGRDTVELEDGTHVLSGKVGLEHPYVRSWHDAGGVFDKSEMDSILSKNAKPANVEDIGVKLSGDERMNFADKIEKTHDNPVNDMGLNPEERNEFITADADDQDEIIKNAVEETDKAVTLADDYAPAPVIEASNPGFMDTLKDNVHPAGLMKGLASGYLAQKGMEIIDPDKSYGEFLDTGLEGALAGGIGATGSALLSGSAAAFAPEVAVGAGAYLLQDYSAKGIGAAEEALGVSKGSEIETASEDIGSSALTGAAVGALAGPVGAAVGAGIGTVLGTAGYLFGRWG